MLEEKNGTTTLQHVHDTSVFFLAAVYLMLLFTDLCLKVCCIP